MHPTASVRSIQHRVRYRLRFRVEVFDGVMTAMGIRTDEDRAALLGLAQSQYTRVKNGTNRPGEAFIAAVLKTLPSMSFEQLFEITEEASR